eukprot:TRINITY_DN3150_c1_g1_i1.p1 TRINITY_DN3150_c1_g1~~TRINITY_DN3150_c1_g1_i1.p1  ORF type:complete len:887 (+),score=327.15 TRINITY_DN3150_c1_g1_i1:308-2662(+)
MNEPVPEVDDSTDVTSPLPSAVLAPNDPSVPNDDNVSQEDGQTENKPTDTSTTDEVDATNLETPNLVHETTQESSELIEESQTSETSETLETSETSESLESSQTVSEIETIPLETGTGNVTKVVVEEAEEMEIPADPIKVVEAHVESIVELPTTPVVKEATSTEAKVEEPQISQEVDAETPLEVSTSEPQVEEATSSDTEVPISNGDVDESQQPIVEEISQEQGSVEAEEHENESDQHSPQTADESHQQEDDDEEAGHEDHYDQEHEEHVQEEQYPHDEEYEEDGPDINHYFATENDSSHSHPPDSLPHTPLDLDHPQLDNGDQVEDGVESQVEDGVEDQVESQVEDQVESQEGSEENQEEEKEVSPEEEKTPQVEVQHEEDSTFKLKKRSRSEDLEEHPPVDSPQLLDLGTPNSENWNFPTTPNETPLQLENHHEDGESRENSESAEHPVKRSRQQESPRNSTEISLDTQPFDQLSEEFHSMENGQLESQVEDSMSVDQVENQVEPQDEGQVGSQVENRVDAEEEANRFFELKMAILSNRVDKIPELVGKFSENSWNSKQILQVVPLIKSLDAFKILLQHRCFQISTSIDYSWLVEGNEVSGSSDHILSLILTLVNSNPIFCEIAKYLLDQGADINVGSGWRRGSIFFSYVTDKDCNEDILDKMLEKGANVNATDDFGSTAVHILSKRMADPKLIRILEKLIARGANVNARDNDDNTPLHFAVRGERMETIEVLIKAGGNPSLRNAFYYTPLREASLKSIQVQRVLKSKLEAEGALSTSALVT